MKRAILIASVLLAVASRAGAGEIGFVENFSLATDREAAIKQLIPGTEDYYYYTALNQQDLGLLDKVDQTLKAWVARYNETPRAMEIENRQALLRLHGPAQEPRLHHLAAGPPLNHQKDEQAAQQANLPTPPRPGPDQRGRPDEAGLRAVPAGDQRL